MRGQQLDKEMDAQLVRFGKTSWREGQRELIAWACEGKHALGVLPTGYGKSLCYQIAAELLGGLSLVVSPLIALMRDQVDGLRALGVAARRYDSSLSPEQREEVLALIARGELRLLYLAPESLEQPDLLAHLEQARLSLFVIDEAHCVSEWGHSFRPDYLKLPELAQRYRFHALMALTATATARVQEDLCRSFAIEPQHSLALSPYRANITRRVLWAEDKEAALLEILGEQPSQPTIIYCRTRQSTEQVAGLLQSAGMAATAYHAGQPAELREQIQDRFLRNEIGILVATIAFGMGVDKPDVRCVIHYHAPSTPEAYVQESGRAGRDGTVSLSLVILNHQDGIDISNRIAASRPDEQALLRCVRWLLPECSRLVSLWELTTECDVYDDVPARALRLMEGHVSQQTRLYKHYHIKPLFPLTTILDGRDDTESTRLRWLDAHREGSLDELAEAWGCDEVEALSVLQDCVDAQEWALKLRQQAWLIKRLDDSLQPRGIAEQLGLYYQEQEEQAYERWQQMYHLFTAVPSRCFNAALEDYFSPSLQHSEMRCGHCATCVGETLPDEARSEPVSARHTLTLPPSSELPHPLNERQTRRFLLGISSPALMRRRLWSHRHYGACAGASWDELGDR